MLQRCLTPAPHTKVKYLSEIVEGSDFQKQWNPRVNYDTFIFVDRLTNNRIMLGEAKNNYSKLHKENRQSHDTHCGPIPKRNKRTLQTSVGKSQQQHGGNKEVEEIRDCLTLMKSTQLFQMETLKNRIFVKVGEEESKRGEEMEDIIKRKKKIREFIERYVSSISL
jgi:hypothetical protein